MIMEVDVFCICVEEKKETKREKRDRRKWKENVDWSSDDCFSLLSVFSCAGTIPIN